MPCPGILLYPDVQGFSSKGIVPLVVCVQLLVASAVVSCWWLSGLAPGWSSHCSLHSVLLVVLVFFLIVSTSCSRLSRGRLRPISPPVSPFRLAGATLLQRLLRSDGVSVDSSVYHLSLRKSRLQMTL